MPHEVFRLETDHISLEVVPAFGARVTTLIDRRTDRNWLVSGALQGDQDDTASYGGNQACGWDECFPTVSPCKSSSWNKNLRDHGELWGRSWSYIDEQSALTTIYTGHNYRFQRRLELVGASVITSYELENCAAAAFPYLWSQHCLLNTRPGEQIVLRGIGDLQTDKGAVGWPLDRSGQDQSTILDAHAGTFEKSYAPVVGEASVGIQSETGSIWFNWNHADAGYFGLWRDFGGWPAENPVHQVALEPTSAPADDLASAKSINKECWLQPGETRHWTISVRLDH